MEAVATIESRQDDNYWRATKRFVEEGLKNQNKKQLVLYGLIVPLKELGAVASLDWCAG